MPYIKTTNYRDMPFSLESHIGDFYVFHCVRDLVKLSVKRKDETMRCRTVGLLQSLHGKFILKDLEVPMQGYEEIRVSMAYMNTVPSLVVPQAVQLFGFLQWKHQPVLFVKLLQVFNIDTAIKIREAMFRITSLHLAKEMHDYYDKQNEENTS